ncbi:HD domain-containing phosphohydrolase [Planctopirus hydrillae]|uniref:Two-component system response regulator n=1 Tax=Planctopirus hydrillae TaxID=1841610 RepID=A0A1C3E8C8_9PLAN|nr:HD domain-containing phosphohydrolase [Planctopirus hydrillae]ODA29486.1 two-component system response regulator [Planctopirus hydrillae]
MKILIVDDDDMILEMLEHTLVPAGYEVLRAHNGTTALEILSQEPCRLVISDWDMPGMSGIDLCRAVRSQDFVSYVYVLLLTSHNSRESLVEGMIAGADDFVNKPFDPEELLVRLRAGVRVLSLETREVLIHSLAKLTESRDPDTGHHLERVQHYSRVLADELSRSERYRDMIDAEFIRLVFLTSPLHDIGKVGVPDSVLLKPGKLTSEEFEVMKRHTTLGSETLSSALERMPEARFLQVARDIAASHHEKFDGSGYPAGLKGTEIPLAARIVALADVYDALTTKRVYKEACSPEVTREIIVNSSGTHFDPDVVDAFISCEHMFEVIREQFMDISKLS